MGTEEIVTDNESAGEMSQDEDDQERNSDVASRKEGRKKGVSQKIASIQIPKNLPVVMLQHVHEMLHKRPTHRPAHRPSTQATEVSSFRHLRLPPVRTPVKIMNLR